MFLCVQLLLCAKIGFHKRFAIVYILDILQIFCIVGLGKPLSAKADFCTRAVFQRNISLRQAVAVVIMPDGKTGAPCGACRELMVQLQPEGYADIEIMLDYKKGKTVRLGELTPEWWITEDRK